MTLGQIIKEYRTVNGYSMDDFSLKSGISKAYISLLEKNKHPKTGLPIAPSIAIIKQAASGMGMPFNHLFELIDSDICLKDNLSDVEDTPAATYQNVIPIATGKLPILGKIACGTPIYMNEEREYYTTTGTKIRADFILIASGDSMINARIYDGDLIFIRKDTEIVDGHIYAVAIDDEATLKRLYYSKENNQVTLVAENPKYTPMVYRDEELDHIHILGEAVAFQSDVK